MANRTPAKLKTAKQKNLPLTKDTRHVIGNYVPSCVLSQQWDQVSDFVRTHTAAMCAGHDFTRNTVRAYLTVLTQLAVWGLDTFGELDIEHLLTNNNIHYFCTRVLESDDDRFRATRRATLNRLGRSLNPKFDARGSAGLGFKRPLEALSPAEEGRIPDWINTQSTCERKRNCGVAVALTLGAGLRTSEVGRLKLHDLDVTEDGIVVKPYGHNGAGPRETVVRARWEDTLLAALDGLEPDDYVYRPNRDTFYPQQVTDYIKRCTTDTLSAPDLRRLRNTWIRDMIFAGVPVDIICDAAGVSSLQQFDHLIRAAGRHRRKHYRALLRGHENPS